MKPILMIVMLCSALFYSHEADASCGIRKANVDRAASNVRRAQASGDASMVMRAMSALRAAIEDYNRYCRQL